MRQGGFSDARQILDQEVAASQHAGQAKPDLVLLAQNDLASLLNDVLYQGKCHEIHTVS
jgi:hypothetical protein